MNPSMPPAVVRQALQIVHWWQRILAAHPKAVRRTLNSSAVISWVMALACLTVLTVYVGFDHSSGNIVLMRKGLRLVQGVFIFNIVCHCLGGARLDAPQTRVVKHIVDGAVILTLLPWIYPQPQNPWLPWLADILYSNLFQYAALSAYSLFILCMGVMRLTSRRTNPALLLASSFMFFILVGSFALMMPRCTVDGIQYIDSLFVSTSAVCITGLSTVDIAATFTPLGQLVLMLLFEIGGLGVITFTSFFAIFFSGRTSIYNQMLVRDIVYSKSMNSLIPTLIYILLFTLAIEAFGTLCIYFTIPAELAATVNDRLWLAAFHSLSAFCNVGFSNIPDGMANAALMRSDQSIYIVMSVLLFAGGVGFPILVNFKDLMINKTKQLFRKIVRRRQSPAAIHLVDLNTKLVLYTTLIILVIGSVAFFLLESGNTMRGMSLYDRIVQSVFNSLIPRSGGYQTVDPARFLNVTLLLVMVQMWIGGSSQSMAGGIKVNTVGAIVLNLRAIVQGRKGVAAFRRNIATTSIRRANAVVTLSLATSFVVAVTLMLLEPQMPAKSIIFETVSATFSVGSSLGITPALSPASKIVVCFTMFIGRVGLLSLLCGLFTARRDASMYYPTGDIIIN